MVSIGCESVNIAGTDTGDIIAVRIHDGAQPERNTRETGNVIGAEISAAIGLQIARIQFCWNSVTVL